MERFLWIFWLARPVPVPGISSPSGPRNARQLFPLRHAHRQPGRLFCLAAVMQAAGAFGWSPTVRSAITIGFIGGLTTYSSFNYETTRLMEDGATGAAAFNAVATIVGAFAAGWFGMVCARQLIGR